MTTTPIVPSLLGHQAESTIRRGVNALDAVLDRLSTERWRTTDPTGTSVVERVAHLAEGAAKLAHAWRARVDAEADGALLHTFDGPHAAPVEMPVEDHGAVHAAYRRGTDQLLAVLGTVREDDWSWPVWSPLGGIETLGEAARRWSTHHLVHHDDVLRALGLTVDHDEDTSRLAAEFVLDAVARRGDDGDVERPLVIEVITSTPGAGTWTVAFDQPTARANVEDIWEALVGHHPEALETYRVERGSTGRARLTVRTDGETLWRVAFRRGASWDDLDVHGDDVARRAWHTLVAHISDGARDGIGPVQH